MLEVWRQARRRNVLALFASVLLVVGVWRRFWCCGLDWSWRQARCHCGSTLLASSLIVFGVLVSFPSFWFGLVSGFGIMHSVGVQHWFGVGIGVRVCHWLSSFLGVGVRQWEWCWGSELGFSSALWFGVGVYIGVVDRCRGFPL